MSPQLNRDLTVSVLRNLRDSQEGHRKENSETPLSSPAIRRDVGLTPFNGSATT